MKYNLDEQLATKSIKQVTAMIKTRLDKDAQAVAYIHKYDAYPYSEYPRYISGVKKAHDVQEDVSAWMSAAVVLFDKELWDQMISDSGYDDSHGYDARTAQL